jgi:hypothetical protein
MKFDGVSFNVEYYVDKSFADFLKDQAHQMPEEKLAEAWYLMFPEKRVKDGNTEQLNTEVPKNKRSSSNSKNL